MISSDLHARARGTSVSEWHTFKEWVGTFVCSSCEWKGVTLIHIFTRGLRKRSCCGGVTLWKQISVTTKTQTRHLFTIPLMSRTRTEQNIWHTLCQESIISSLSVIPRLYCCKYFILLRAQDTASVEVFITQNIFFLFTLPSLFSPSYLCISSCSSVADKRRSPFNVSGYINI